MATEEPAANRRFCQLINTLGFCIPHTVILKSLLGLDSRSHSEQFKRRQETANLAIRTARLLPESFPKFTNVRLFKELLPWVFVPTWPVYAFLDKNAGDLMIHWDLRVVVVLYCPLSYALDVGMGLMPTACLLLLWVD